ncbi:MULTISPECIES: hypothetical protein [Paenibacillus]|uniref:Uncharacterized protein n=1 Tax=Paenibacillus borealis TaxID=160799 RepID=A0ABX3GTS4_PAEBO|nr:hypothetical protein [Paenibacillus borealis]OMD35016.1 hypothetical protein BSK56_33305 [Paenibacillus borealis]
MYKINLFESSMHSNHLNNNTYIKFDFDLKISESIQFIDIQVSDQTHRLQNILDIQVSAKVNSTFLKKAVGQVQPNIRVFNQGSGYREWDWIFDSNDISAIEGVRSGDLYFTIDVTVINIAVKAKNRIAEYLVNVFRFLLIPLRTISEGLNIPTNQIGGIARDTIKKFMAIASCSDMLVKTINSNITMRPIIIRSFLI